MAIKTLKSSAKEADRIKFLQEGAIMGQFRHTNVVALHGIVREGQKVSVSLGGTAIDIILDCHIKIIHLAPFSMCTDR